ncbi:MAG: hypothetical protein V5788_02960 [Shewanella sp.]
MKKLLLVASILAVTSMGAQADSATGILEWNGFVGGVVAGENITLTGLNGGVIEEGLLNIDDTGEFVSQRAIAVEAHAYDTSTLDTVGGVMVGDEFAGNLEWTIHNLSVSDAAYDIDILTFDLSGHPIAPGISVSTVLGENFVSISVAYPEAVDVTPGDAVQVSATIVATVLI